MPLEWPLDGTYLLPEVPLLPYRPSCWPVWPGEPDQGQRQPVQETNTPTRSSRPQNDVTAADRDWEITQGLPQHVAPVRPTACMGSCGGPLRERRDGQAWQ